MAEIRFYAPQVPTGGESLAAAGRSGLALQQALESLGSTIRGYGQEEELKRQQAAKAALLGDWFSTPTTSRATLLTPTTAQAVGPELFASLGQLTDTNQQQQEELARNLATLRGTATAELEQYGGAPAPTDTSLEDLLVRAAKAKQDYQRTLQPRVSQPALKTVETFDTSGNPITAFVDPAGQTVSTYPREVKPTDTAPKLSKLAEKQVSDAIDDYTSYTTAAQTSNTLADRIDQLNATGNWKSGVFGKATEYFRDIFGSQDDISVAKKQYTELFNKEVIGALPPGVATDNDVRIFAGGFPDASWNPEKISSWLRGRAKAADAASAFAEYKQNYITNNGSLGKSQDGKSFIDNWRTSPVYQRIQEATAPVSRTGTNVQQPVFTPTDAQISTLSKYIGG